MTRRVVITGLGIVAPNGTNKDEFWANCLSDIGVVAPIPDSWRNYFNYTSNVWAPLPQLNLDPLNLTLAELKQRDKSAYLALLAATAAIADANLECTLVNVKDNKYQLPQIESERAGVIIGTGIAGSNTFASHQAYHLLHNPYTKLQNLAKERNENCCIGLEELIANLKMPPRFNPFAISMTMSNALSAIMGIKFSITGLNHTIVGACAAGTMAIGNAFTMIKHGQIDLSLTGGIEHIGDDFGIVFRGFNAGGVLTQNNDPKQANRPFDINRSGMLLAEGGAGILVLEELEHALARKAHIYAEIVGYSETLDAYSMMMIEPSGKSIILAINQALNMANLSPNNIDYINAHGTGTKLNDETEAHIIQQVFGNQVLVNSTKSLIGHTIGASGAIEAIVCALSLRDQTTHPCHNLTEPLTDLNFVRTTTPHKLQNVLSQSFAFGGHNAILIMRAWDQ